MSKYIIEIDDEIVENMLDEGVCKGDAKKVVRLYQATIADAIKNGTPYNPTGDCISREVINSEIEKRYCSKHCVVPSEEPYCPDNCPARFLKNIVKECKSVPQVVVFAENTDEKAIEDMKAELQNVIEARPQGVIFPMELVAGKCPIEAGGDCPLRPKGEWMMDGHHIRCNRCNEYICNTDREGNKIPDNFCPNCGADMRKGDAE